MAKLYVSSTGAGLQDGSSWANASTINNLSSLIEKAGPGGEVLVRADQGAYQVNSPIIVAAGGQSGSPVSIRGVDAAGRDMNAAIVGNRAENWEPGKAQGSEVFRLLDGADNLNFENFAFKNVGNGAFRVGDNISNLAIADVTANNVTRFFENTISGSASSATIDGLSIKNVDIDGYSLGAIRLRYNTNDVTIENVTADSQRQAGGQYIFGVILDGTAHDVLIRNVEMKNNNATSSPDKYWNGDGFTTERGVYGVRFEDTKASGNTDAGYDLKSSDTLLVNAYSEGNSRNYRFWSEGIKVQDSVSVNPETHGGSVGEAHVWLGDNAKVQFTGLKIVDDGSTKASMFELGSNATVIADKLPADYIAKSIIENGSSIAIGQVDGVPALPDQPEVPDPTPEPTVPNPQPTTGVVLKGTSASDTLAGGDANESIVGGGGFDFLSGGRGSDVFVFNDVSEIGTKRYQRDIISDFQVGVDKIDLSGIDANGDAAGNGTFSLITSGSAFTDAAQIQWAHQSKGSQDVTIIAGDINGDGNADFQLELSGHLKLTSNDFIFVPASSPEPTLPNPQPTTGVVLKGTSASDTLAGGDANESIVGGGGFDILSGGKGSDLFVFNDVSEIGTKRYQRDVVTDFQVGVDKIDLSGIDANGDASGNGTFTVITSGSEFTDAGQVRWAHQSKGSQDVTVIAGDIHGDGNGDFQLELSGHLKLTSDDFIL